ncbi:MAG: T9SS type A sorting domain-containing protein [Saprospiraceae bacterium]|nr:T9SS type A sorting domain-containing protein [Saprospiraceae bacterium]
MKKFIFSLICLYGLQNLVAQIPPFAPVGAKWYIHATAACFGNPNGEDGNYTLLVTEDSIIQGKYCTLVPTNQGPFCQEYYFVHQDGNEVYIFSHEENVFHLLYDFDAPVGASWKIPVCDWAYFTDSVIITVLQDFPNYQEVSAKGVTPIVWGFSNTKVYKGIGGIYDNPLLFTFPNKSAPLDCSHTLRCYETPATGVIHLQGMDCVPSAAVEFSSSENSVQVYPNPANDRIALSFPIPLPISARWILHNQLGQAVFQSALPLGENEVSLHLPAITSGIYFWWVESDSGLLGSGKLVISK